MQHRGDYASAVTLTHCPFKRRHITHVSRTRPQASGKYKPLSSCTRASRCVAGIWHLLLWPVQLGEVYTMTPDDDPVPQDMTPLRSYLGLVLWLGLAYILWLESWSQGLQNGNGQAQKWPSPRDIWHLSDIRCLQIWQNEIPWVFQVFQTL